jgi:hypothetical protein
MLQQNPKSEIEHQEREKSIEKWQQQWDNSTKGLATKEFFPNLKDRLQKKIHLTPNFTAMVTAMEKQDHTCIDSSQQILQNALAVTVIKLLNT